MLELEHNPHIQVYRVSEFHDELSEVITEGLEFAQLLDTWAKDLTSSLACL